MIGLYSQKHRSTLLPFIYIESLECFASETLPILWLCTLNVIQAALSIILHPVLQNYVLRNKVEKKAQWITEAASLW